MKLKISIKLYLGLFLLLGSFNGFAQKNEGSNAANELKNTGVVKVAYDTVAKKNLTYSVSEVKGSALLNTSAFLPGNTLYGKLAGLTVIQRTGEPGNDQPTLFLRGRATTASNAPLIMVDGIERDLNDVQTEDIESITVLKDAASAIIYGIRGANGVIMVNTKRGTEGKLKFNGSVDQFFSTPTRKPEFYNAANFVQLYNQAMVNDGFAPQYSASQIAGYNQGNATLYPNVNWQDEVTKDYALGTRSNFNVAGGEKIAKYYVSLGYFHQGGIYSNTESNEGYSTNLALDNFSFRSNLDLNVSKYLSFGLDLSGRIYQKNSPSTSTATTWDLLNKYPSHIFPVYVQDGIYGGTAIYPNNPMGYINSKGFRQTNYRTILSTLYGKYNLSQFVKGLTFNTRFSADNVYSNQEGYTKNFAVREIIGTNANGAAVLSPGIGSNTNLATLTASGYPYNDTQAKRNTLEAGLAFKPELANNNSLNMQVIYHQDRLMLGNETPYNFQFLAGKFNYGIKGKYFAELGASYSGTEAFEEGNKFGFFPAVSAAWLISEETFMKGSSVFNFLKLRASAGIVGNSAIGERFSFFRQYIGDTGYNFGNANAAQAGLSSGTLPNSDFTWEKARKYDLGIDARLFNFLDVSLTAFLQKRKDILITRESLTPGIIGANVSTTNTGKTSNKGFEASLGFKKLNKNLGFRASFNISYVTDKVDYYPEPNYAYGYIYKTGNRISQPFMLEAIGFFNSPGDIQNSPTQSFGAVQPGDIKYKDQNADGKIDGYDEIALNNTTLPSWDLGLDFGFNYKNFDINASLQGQLGRSLYLGNEPLLFWPLQNDGGKISTYAKQFWTPQTAATADYPRLSAGPNNNNYRESTFWYVNGDFLRLRSLDIGYTLPSALVQKVKLSKAKFFVRGTNLFTLDHLKFTDPEVMSGYPVMKSYNVGLNLQF
ncbi:TonB-dependent receptor [Pedobacter frigiditerrae]|uniref:TonB-dependent receptor n=1 Tax=Pedobacter frigiditerrae TaxID=2530452 RepID=A0A4R0MRB2_9SPHI|nr:TonB-dependent receptor [Pedobacter frigiditerrae]TCC88574.1 TonB-dependent receptor [Pedobacter frigiditerrae]